ncbi:Uncharacterised protein [Chlamydia trachomatis]|nr:Uncharacterised protein [Chlamydia trachomatis]
MGCGGDYNGVAFRNDRQGLPVSSVTKEDVAPVRKPQAGTVGVAAEVRVRWRVHTRRERGELLHAFNPLRAHNALSALK